MSRIDAIEEAWRAQGGAGTRWPPPQYRLNACLARGAGDLRRGRYAAAAKAFAEASRCASGAERELARGLVHLSAAGYRRRQGDERRAERQLAHARRRLAAHVPRSRNVDVAELLAQAVEA